MPFHFLTNCNILGSGGREYTLYSLQPPKVEWHHQFLERQKTWKVYRQNPSLPEGQEKIVVKGVDEAVVKSWVTITKKDGITSKKQLGNSIYKPMPYVIEKNNSDANNTSKRNEPNHPDHLYKA